MQQALEYAEILDVPFAYSSNGDAFLEHDRTGISGVVEREIPLDQFPTPEELWARYRAAKGYSTTQETIATQDYFDDGSGKAPRYYQLIAINRTVDAIARGESRILLVMATSTGKTYTAFQIIWRLWKSGAKKRILFLVDRNILADQTKTNDFKPFGQAMTKITNRTADKAYEIYLSLYQAVTGTEEEQNIYKQFSPDFFDLIVVEECHRGSAADDAAWRKVLEYFSSATQIGLTATPKETKEVSNIEYFGDPIYTYSLRQGISDGFLAPYKVVRIGLDKDLEGYFARLCTRCINQAAVNTETLKEQLIPLPPLAEQKRIVAKVDELMALCDRLEVQQQELDARHAALARASLARFAEAPTTVNLDFLFHNSYTITPADLRKTILTLAVQGKLVPQDPNDECAEVSLTKAVQHQQVLWSRTGSTKSTTTANAKSIPKKIYVAPGIANVADVHKIPDSWVWAVWGDLLEPDKGAFKRGPFGSSLRKSDFVASGYKVYEQYCPINDDCSFARYFITEAKFKTMESFAVRSGDFLVSCSGVTLGRITQVPKKFEPGIINQALLRVRMSGTLIDSAYFKMLFRSPYFQRIIFENSTGSAQPNVKGVKDLKAIPIPTPPLAEQRRIVAKVDQLMALVDQLEMQLTASRATAEKLMEAVVAELTTQERPMIEGRTVTFDVEQKRFPKSNCA